jgi:hypothetical protein
MQHWSEPIKDGCLSEVIAISAFSYRMTNQDNIAHNSLSNFDYSKSIQLKF